MSHIARILFKLPVELQGRDKLLVRGSINMSNKFEAITRRTKVVAVKDLLISCRFICVHYTGNLEGITRMSSRLA